MFWLTASSENVFQKQSSQKESIHSCFSELSFSRWSMELEQLSSNLCCWLPAHDHEQMNYDSNFSYKNHRRGQITHCPGSMGCFYKTWNWIQVFCIPGECQREHISLINTGTALSFMGINCLASLTCPLSNLFWLLCQIASRAVCTSRFLWHDLPLIGWHWFECPSFFFFYSCAQKERLSIFRDVTHPKVES